MSAGVVIHSARLVDDGRVTDDAVRHVRRIAALAGTEGVLGVHLEGPFLATGHRGAHDPALLRTPDLTDIDRLLEAARGSIRQITLAPELPGADAAIARLSAAPSMPARRSSRTRSMRCPTCTTAHPGRSRRRSM